MPFKHLTPENWTERDPINEVFHHVYPAAGAATPLAGEDWAREFLAVELEAGVPEAVQNLFAVARGTMLYGHFFYPLYTLGYEQLQRVADAATAHRYRSLGGAPTKKGQLPPFRLRIEAGDDLKRAQGIAGRN